ncbi:MAG: radical SAM protein [Myxococcota bacterium]|nr:radical SAM protein [Myxococcota bacterium]
MGNFDAQSDWSGFVKSAIENTIPFTVHWDLTWRCDHKCVHCYLTDRRKPELDVDESIAVLDQLVDAGTLSILFSGGDPFLRPDGIDIMRAARQRDFDVRINTHGNFIDDAMADELARIGVARVSLSVYSANASEHDAVTLIPGSHQKTLDAARRLVARDVAVNFKTPVMVQNRDSYQTVGPIAEDIGASWELDAHIVPDDQSDFGLCSIGVHDGERVLAMMHQVAERRNMVTHWANMPDASSTARTCGAGTAMAYISPDGILYPCLNWRDPIGDLRENSFKSLWRDSAAIKRQREVTRASYESDCGGCSFQGKCHYCPGISHAEHGSAGRRSAYVCERTHLTMTAFEHLEYLNQVGQPIPKPGSPEAVDILSRTTFAKRQWSARKAGVARPSDQVRPNLFQILEPGQR